MGINLQDALGGGRWFWKMEKSLPVEMEGSFWITWTPKGGRLFAGFKQKEKGLRRGLARVSAWVGFSLSRVPPLTLMPESVSIDVLKLPEAPLRSQGDSLLLKMRTILTGTPSLLFISESQEYLLERVGCHLISHWVSQYRINSSKVYSQELNCKYLGGPWLYKIFL